MYGAGVFYIAMRVDVTGIMVLIVGLACVLVCGLRLRGNGRPDVNGMAARVRFLCPRRSSSWRALRPGSIISLAGMERRWDVTRARQHTLSQYTAEILHNLHDRVEVTTFHVGLPPNYLEDLLLPQETLAERPMPKAGRKSQKRLF